ncbi:hypothetical protein NPU96_001720 [Vibrio alginolyticus]|nr:hypothetical protein [Vibrio alginolyticus]
MKYLKMMAASLAMLSFTGCVSTPETNANAQSEVTPINNPIYSDQDFLDLVTKLNTAGQGSITNCTLTSTSSVIKTGYSNSFDREKLFVTVSDEYGVNYILLHLYPDDLKVFRETLITASDKAKSNESLENLTLVRYSSFRTEVTFISRYGKLFGFWTRSPDRVLTPINANNLLQCINQVSKQL